jgi:hypothetical protein
MVVSSAELALKSGHFGMAQKQLYEQITDLSSRQMGAPRQKTRDYQTEKNQS